MTICKKKNCLTFPYTRHQVPKAVFFPKYDLDGTIIEFLKGCFKNYFKTETHPSFTKH